MIVSTFKRREVPEELWETMRSKMRSHCHASPSSEASRAAFERASHLVIAWNLVDKANSDGYKLVVGGFALLHASPKSSPPHMYIDVICSKSQQGGAIMAKATALARAYKYKRMGIRPKSVVSEHYKRRYGFKPSNDACKNASSARKNKSRKLGKCIS